MPYAKTSYVSLVDYSTGNVEKKTVVGSIKFCVRPPAASPKWLLIASDAGEIRVFNNAGVYQASHSFDLGWNPDQVAINNLDPPHVLVRRTSNFGIYCYRSGSLLWSVLSITGLGAALISDGYVHTLIVPGSPATCYVQWRSLTDGSVVTTGAGGRFILAGGLAVTESGGKAFWINWRSVYTTIDIVCDDRTAGNIFRTEVYVSSYTLTVSELRVVCAADGSLVLWRWNREYEAPIRWVRLTTGASGAALYTGNPSAAAATRVNPAGARAGYVDGGTLYKLTALGAVSSVALGGPKAASDDCLDLTDDPYYLPALNNGNIEIYDDALSKKATIAYELSDTPMAVVRRTS